MAVLIKWRKARKPHKCSWCGGTIRRGERYAYTSLTPRDGEIGNDRWLHATNHGATGADCPWPPDDSGEDRAVVTFEDAEGWPI